MTKPPTDAPVPEDATGKQKATRTFTKPGFHRQTIQIHEAAWAKIISHVEAETYDLDKWLTKQLSEIAGTL
jgi:hypothetical protein